MPSRLMKRTVGSASSTRSPIGTHCTISASAPLHRSITSSPVVQSARSARSPAPSSSSSSMWFEGRSESVIATSAPLMSLPPARAWSFALDRPTHEAAEEEPLPEQVQRHDRQRGELHPCHPPRDVKVVAVLERGQARHQRARVVDLQEHQGYQQLVPDPQHVDNR